MSSSFKKVAEETVNGEINGFLEKLLQHLQSERDRLVGKVHKLADDPSSSVKFVKSAEFDKIMGKLLLTPFGNIEKQQMEDKRLPSVCSKNPYVLAESGGASSSANWLPRSAADNQRRRKMAKTDYDDMEPVAVVSGPDMTGRSIMKPSSIAAIPDWNCFAVFHNTDSISILSAAGELKSTVILENRCLLKAKNVINSPVVLRVNPTNNSQLICIHSNDILTVDLALDQPQPVATASVQSRVSITTSPIFGLGISSRYLYAAADGGIVGYSLSDWRTIGSWPFFRQQIEGNKSLVLEVFENQLFYRGDSGHSVFSVPIRGDGYLEMNESTPVSYNRFGFLQSLTRDSSGTILAIDKESEQIEALSADGREVLSTFTLPKSYSSFSPADVAVITSVDQKFVFAKNKRSDRVVATPDFFGNRIVFFAPISESSTL